MKYQQQVSVDLVNMVYTAIAYLALAGAAWLFLRLIQACFWLPSHMKRQNDVQRMLQEKVDSYERYIEQCEAKEAAGEVEGDDASNLEEKRKERRECLDMLKRELKRIQDGGDPYDFDYLLEEEKKLLEEVEEEEGEEEEKDTGSEKSGKHSLDGEKLMDKKSAIDKEEFTAVVNEPKKDK